MSALSKKVAVQLDKQIPQEFDENWVNQLLTEKGDNQPKNIKPSQASRTAKDSVSNAALIEAELRKRRIIRKAKQLEAAQKAASNVQPRIKPDQSTLSAIEKQKRAFTVKKETEKQIKQSQEDNNKKKGFLFRLAGL
jgi:hypothetical protein